MMIHILITVKARQYAFSKQENALFETMEAFNKFATRLRLAWADKVFGEWSLWHYLECRH